MKHALLALLMTLCMIAGAQAAQVNKVAAVVNGKVITMYDLQKTALPDLIRARINPNDPKQSKEMDLILRKALDNMIMDILLEQEAVRLKATVSESDVDEELATIMKTNGLTKAQFEQRLAAQKIPLKELRENLRKKIIRQKIMGQEVGRKVVVGESVFRHEDRVGPSCPAMGAPVCLSRLFVGPLPAYSVFFRRNTL